MRIATAALAPLAKVVPQCKLCAVLSQQYAVNQHIKIDLAASQP